MSVSSVALAEQRRTVARLKAAARREDQLAERAYRKVGTSLDRFRRATGDASKERALRDGQDAQRAQALHGQRAVKLRGQLFAAQRVLDTLLRERRR